MEARAKTIENWFSLIEQGAVRLPRFQRHEAWRPAQIDGLFENVLRSPSLPIGVLLVLEVGNAELFHSRPIVGAPDLNVRPQLQLLDGQQRMTALWRALNDDYPELTGFVRLRPHENSEDGQVEFVKRWDRKGVRQPVWCDDPVACLERGLAPIRILRPGAGGEAAFKDWRKAVRDAGTLTDDVGDQAQTLRGRLAAYQLPFLSLPPTTARETALEVFINMNTSATPLKDYDIVVAQVEEGAGISLHDQVAALAAEVPAARDYGPIEDIILSVAALLLGRPPLKTEYLHRDFGRGMADVWPQVTAGLKQGLAFLADEAMLSERVLPSEVAVYLTCALWAVAAEQKLDSAGNARALIRKVLWRACLTDRYGKTSATRAYADFRVLSEAITDDADASTCELFNEDLYRLPENAEIRAAGWPGRKDRLPRAILAISLRRSAQDFADGTPLSRANVADRELDHLYSCQFLGLPREDTRVSRALNCALITTTTNRNKQGDAPSIYIAKRAAAANLGQEAVRHRLATHLIPHTELIADDYEAFLDRRTKLVADDMLMLAVGAEPQL